jgi:hypothetical protein
MRRIVHGGDESFVRESRELRSSAVWPARLMRLQRSSRFEGDGLDRGSALGDLVSDVPLGGEQVDRRRQRHVEAAQEVRQVLVQIEQLRFDRLSGARLLVARSLKPSKEEWKRRSPFPRRSLASVHGQDQDSRSCRRCRARQFRLCRRCAPIVRRPLRPRFPFPLKFATSPAGAAALVPARLIAGSRTGLLPRLPSA